jgi:hypothetical protein
MLRRKSIQKQRLLYFLEVSPLQLGQEAPNEDECQGIQTCIDPHRTSGTEMVD